MIIELKKNNLEIIKDSFLSTSYVENEFLNNPFAKFLILIEKNEIIGYLYYSDIYDRIEINQFEIKNIHRNSGKGSILLKELLDKTEKDISLEVKNDNDPAIHLYEKFGFKKVAIRKGYYHGIDAILMERKYRI